MAKRVYRHPLILNIPSELEFHPRAEAKELGLPLLHEDVRNMLHVHLPGYGMIDDLERRFGKLQSELDFQINRITEWSDDSSVKASPSELVQMIKQRIQERLAHMGKLSFLVKAITFDVPTDLEFAHRSTTGLPSGVNPSHIVEQVLNFCQMKSLFAKYDTWKPLLLGNVSSQIMINAFWWVLLEVFHRQKEETTTNQALLHAAIASHLRELKDSLDQYQRPLFAKNFADVLAKWLYTAFLEAFPAQAAHFKHRFRELVVRCAARWTSTPPIAPRHWRKWDPWLLVSDRPVTILRTTLRIGVSRMDLLNYDYPAFEADIARLRKELNRLGTDSATGGTSTTPPSSSRLQVRHSTLNPSVSIKPVASLASNRARIIRDAEKTSRSDSE